MIKKEIWKDIQGYEGLYQVRNSIIRKSKKFNLRWEEDYAN